MKQTEKGVVLILTLVVTFLLLSFAVGITIVATNSYRLTTIYERNNRLKLVAESGRERGEVALKNYIMKDPTTTKTVFTDPDNFDPSLAVPSAGINFQEGNVKCKVTILHDDMTSTQMDPDHVDQDFTTYVIPSATSTKLPRKYPDRATNRNLDYILIRSEAENIKTNEKKVLDTYIDKKDISNIYFDRLFNSSFTVAGPLDNLGTEAFKVESNVDLKLSGTVFLQGDKVTIKPKLSGAGLSFQMQEGDIYVKSKSPLGLPGSGLNPVSSIPLDVTTMFKSPSNITTDPNWKNTLIRGLDMLEISSVDMDTFTVGAITPDEVKPGTIHYSPTTTYPTLITYKAKAPIGSPLNFTDLIDGTDRTWNSQGLYFQILKYLNTQTLPLGIVDSIDYYGRVYKVIMVEGDLVMDDNADELFNSYIIYCSGNVNFNGNCNFYNSSIFAKSITFNNDPSKDYKVNFAGINTKFARNKEVEGTHLFDFSQADKGNINSYLISNLTGYADYLKFRTIDWRQY